MPPRVPEQVSRCLRRELRRHTRRVRSSNFRSCMLCRVIDIGRCSAAVSICHALQLHHSPNRRSLTPVMSPQMSVRPPAGWRTAQGLHSWDRFTPVSALNHALLSSSVLVPLLSVFISFPDSLSTNFDLYSFNLLAPFYFPRLLFFRAFSWSFILFIPFSPLSLTLYPVIHFF